MYQTISKSDFRDAFVHANRKDNFSYEALGALYDYIEEMDENYELDVIALCCEFSEQEIPHVLEQYNVESLHDLDTQVIWHNDTHVLFLAF